MSRVLNILTYIDHGDTPRFAGLLRNEKQFGLFQNVFIMYGTNIVQCKIVGIELPPTSNADYIYKIEIPSEFIDKKSSGNERVSMICDNIFSSINEAKESALKHIEKYYELNKRNVENFFNKYE